MNVIYKFHEKVTHCRVKNAPNIRPVKNTLARMKIFFLFLILALLSVQVAISQNKVITGTITSAEDGSPLPGATISVKRTTIGAVTDIDGNFTLLVPQNTTTVTVSFVGMKNQDIDVSTTTTVKVALSPDLVGIDEVVVTALGISSEKKALGYSVSEVKSKEITNSRETNIVNALAGKIPGVQINNSSGMAGSSSRITIRGVSSLNYNNQPLFVIDGVPYDNSEYNFNEGSANVDDALFYGSTANTGIDIDPNQIENVSVLKGANASALYGSKAANGVILITTKGGGLAKLAKPRITVNSRVGWDKIMEPKIQRKYGQGINGVFFDGNTPNGKTSLVWGPKLDTTNLPTYNPFDFFQTGITSDQSVGIEGSTKFGNYYLSYSNLNQKGTVPKNFYLRNNVLAKYSAKITDKFTISGKLGYTKSDNDRLAEGNGQSSVMWTLLCGPVTYNFFPAVDENGEQRLYRSPLRNNPYWLKDNTLYTESRDRFTPDIAMEYNILPWMKLTGKVGLDYYSSFSKFYENAGNRGEYTNGRILETRRSSRSLNSDIILHINKDFGTDFKTNILFGNNINTQYYNSNKIQGTNFIIPDFYSLSNVTSYVPEDGTSKVRTTGVYAQAITSYKSLLYLTLTARNDWTSTLPTKNNSYFYPAAGLGFIFTELMGETPALAFGKLRLSLAQVGNGGPYAATYTSNNRTDVGDGQRGQIDFPFRGTGSYSQSNIMGNPDLKPEITTEKEVGLELKFFNNRFGLDVSLYDKISKNQIILAPIASETGFVNRLVNVGEISNKGIELQVYVTPVKFTDFDWTINMTYSKNKNKVVSLTEGVENIRLAGFTSPGIFIKADQPYGVIWGSRYKRNEAGKVIIDDDQNSPFYGMPVKDDDLGPIGNATPNWVGGLRNTFSWKGLSASALIDVRNGGDLMNLDENYTAFYGSSILTENRDNPMVFPDAVKESNGQPNDIGLNPQDYWQTIVNYDEFFIQKSQFVRLRELSVSYSVPTKWLSKVKIASVNVTLTGRNIWNKFDKSFTGSDPEQSLYGSGNGQGFLSFNMPSSKSYNVALSVTF